MNIIPLIFGFFAYLLTGIFHANIVRNAGPKSAHAPQSWASYIGSGLLILGLLTFLVDNLAFLRIPITGSPAGYVAVLVLGSVGAFVLMMTSGITHELIYKYRKLSANVVYATHSTLLAFFLLGASFAGLRLLV